jgi:hypothetical protein
MAPNQQENTRFSTQRRINHVTAPTEDKTDVVKVSYYGELEDEFDKFPKYHMKILFGDFSAKVGREPTTGNVSLHEISNCNGIRVVNLATFENLTVKSMTFPYCNIQKYTWASPNGKSKNQIDHILIDRSGHSSVLDGLSFRAANCDTDHYLLVAKVKGKLSVNKQISYGELKSQKVK